MGAGITNLAVDKFFLTLSLLESNSIEPGHANTALAPLGNIPPFLRALLVADGTVTMALEAFFGETIRIRTIRQGPMPLPAALQVLAMEKGDACYFREIELLGEATGKIYGHATSILNKQAIKAELFDELVDEHVGIGVILRNSAKGSFREVLAVKSGGLMSDYDVHRIYRVSLNARPAILITEEFPIAVYTSRQA